MNIVNNYQIFSNRLTIKYFHHEESKKRNVNSLQYGMDLKNSYNSYGKYITNIYKPELYNITFKSALNKQELRKAAETIFSRSKVFGLKNIRIYQAASYLY